MPLLTEELVEFNIPLRYRLQFKVVAKLSVTVKLKLGVLSLVFTLLGGQLVVVFGSVASTVNVTLSVVFALPSVSLAPTLTVFEPSTAVKEVFTQSYEILVSQESREYQHWSTAVSSVTVVFRVTVVEL